jgi:hypothetical protein
MDSVYSTDLRYVFGDDFYFNPEPFPNSIDNDLFPSSQGYCGPSLGPICNRDGGTPDSTDDSSPHSPGLTLTPLSSVSLLERSEVDRGSQSRSTSASSGGSFDSNSKNQLNQYFCDVEGCAMSRKPFKRKYELNRHKKEQHSPDHGCYRCGLCKKVNVRRDKMIKHLRSVHKMPEGATPEECPSEGCMDSITVLFTSRLEVDDHVGAMHKTLDSTKPGR